MIDLSDSNSNSKKEQGVVIKIFDLLLERVLKKLYSGLDAQNKKLMSETMLSGNEKKKNQFFKNNFSVIDTIFKQEIEKIVEEIKEKVQKQ